MRLIINTFSINKMMMVMMLILVVMLSDGCSDYERLALLQLRDSMDSPYEIAFTDWGSHTNCCQWKGVSCDDTTLHVTEIYLEGSGGKNRYLNVSMFLSFHRLQILRLNNMGIFGCIEDKGFERLSALKNLEILNLWYNNLNNSLLPSIGRISSLKYLNLGKNKLEGSIDMKEIKDLNKLEELIMSYNNISTIIVSKGFGRQSILNKLKTLDLSETYLNNSLFSSISRISSLKYLVLSNNKLEGSIDTAELKDLNKLEELVLDYNNITEIVISKGMRKLNTLVLDGVAVNERNFRIRSLWNSPSLKSIYLSFNKFKGPIFDEDLHSAINIEEIVLDSSSMDEDALDSLGALSSLRNLSMREFTQNTPTQEGSNLHRWIDKKLSSFFPNLRYLDLSRINLHPTISKGLCKLNRLQILRMNKNNLFIGNLPSCMGNLTSLIELSLSSNNLVGDLPSSLTNLTSLASLDLSSNQFSWDISLSPLKSLSSLESLGLEHNFVKIPCSLNPFLNHSQLESLFISHNEVYNDNQSHNIPIKLQLKSLGFSNPNGNCRAVPKFLRNQHDLEEVDLSSFKLESKFPSWLLDNNPNLQKLLLGNTSLFGHLQLPKDPHTKLESLDLSGNGFTGIIPSSVSQMSALTSLDLSNNHLQGNIPTWISHMYALQFLNLANNGISGTLPPSFTPPFLIHLLLSRNQLNGTINDKFNNSPFLETIDLSHNHLMGVIPNLTIFYGLKYLLLSHNKLKGEIPINLCKLNELHWIDFSRNDLHGKIPSCLRVRGDIKSMLEDVSYLKMSNIVFNILNVLLSLEFTTKSFTYFYQYKILPMMVGIDLSCNNLIGDIPLEIGDLYQMKTLNLSHNNLIGPIPTTFSNLKDIESLDLSYNNLSGNIPSELKNLYSIEVFSVAYNNLSGKTPDRVNQFATFNETSYMGNLFLCGEPLNKSCEPGETQLPSHSNERNEDGFMDMDSFYITFSVTYVIVFLGIVTVLYINPYWRKAWFYFIEVNMTQCYYFLLDSLPIPSKLEV